MRVLDTNYLVDYLDAHESAEAYFVEQGGPDERWIVPAPAYAETLVGVGNLPGRDVGEAIDALAWTEVYDTSGRLAADGARIADEIGPQGPALDGIDAVVAAVGRELDAPVVSADSDFTHAATRAVIDVESHRDVR